MIEGDSAEVLVATLAALEETVAILIAKYYSADELGGIVNDHWGKAGAVLEPPEGVSLLPSMRSPAAREVAMKWRAMAVLFERARRLNLKAKAEREAAASAVYDLAIRNTQATPAEAAQGKR